MWKTLDLYRDSKRRLLPEFTYSHDKGRDKEGIYRVANLIFEEKNNFAYTL